MGIGGDGSAKPDLLLHCLDSRNGTTATAAFSSSRVATDDAIGDIQYAGTIEVDAAAVCQKERRIYGNER